MGSVQEAKLRLLALQQADPAEYYVCDLVERRVVAAVTQARPELHTVSDDSDFFVSPKRGPHSSWWHAGEARVQTIAGGGKAVRLCPEPPRPQGLGLQAYVPLTYESGPLKRSFST